jgi:DNA mismatch repair protein MutL
MRTTEEISSKIIILPEHLIDQIKAGEVIERPANLIKEILENSIDAHAKNINLHLVNEGMELISLEDDGHGMSHGDLPYAFCRHATSKIISFEDLYRLRTFGFRGEALASIAAVSKITCVSTPLDTYQSGGQIVLESGMTISHSLHKGRRHGTSLYIKDLFYNTPARLKFIKSAQSEKNAIRKTIDSFIISHPEITFTIRYDDEDKMIYQAIKDGNHQKRIEQLFYPTKKAQQDARDQVCYFEQEYEGHIVRGLISRHSVRGTSKRKQFLFANDRHFIDKQIHQLISRSMESRGWHDGPGHYYLAVKVPTSQIDVNVHPNKTYIKFLKHSLILSLISNNIKKSFEPIAQASITPLTEITGNNQSTTPIEHFIQGPTDHEQKKNISTGLVHNLYQLCQKDQQSYLIHKKNLTSSLFEYLAKKSYDDESWQTPLLISEPFQRSSYTLSHDALERLRNYGFVVEIIDDNTYVLRSIPNLCIGLDLNVFMHYLLKADASIDALDLSQYYYSNTFMQNLLDYPELSPQQWCVSLSETKVADLFCKQ